MVTVVRDSMLAGEARTTHCKEAKPICWLSESADAPRKSLLSRLEGWIQNELPPLNAAIETGNKSPTEFAGMIAPLLREIGATMHPLMPRLSTSVRRRLARDTGFLVASAERHFQMTGAPAGTTWRFVPEAEQFTDDLMRSMGLPPAMSVYAYWLDNPAGYSFTGEPGERAFGELVRLWDDNCEAAGDALRAISLGQFRIGSADAAEAIATAARLIAEISIAYKALGKQPDGSYGLTFHAFNRMRNYLCPWQIYGRSSTGPNAANLRSQWSVDVLGLGMEGYVEMIADRMEFVTPEDREIIHDDMVLPSVPERFLDRLRLNRREFLATDDAAVADRIAEQPVAYTQTLIEFARFHKSLCQLSAAHRQSIKFILIDTVGRMTAEEIAKYPVPPTRSVGGADHSRPFQIDEMRRHEPVVQKLLRVLKLVTARRQTT